MRQYLITFIQSTILLCFEFLMLTTVIHAIYILIVLEAYKVSHSNLIPAIIPEKFIFQYNARSSLWSPVTINLPSSKPTVINKTQHFLLIAGEKVQMGMFVHIIYIIQPKFPWHSKAKEDAQCFCRCLVFPLSVCFHVQFCACFGVCFVISSQGKFYFFPSWCRGNTIAWFIPVHIRVLRADSRFEHWATECVRRSNCTHKSTGDV